MNQAKPATPQFEVSVISGCAGGLSRKASVNLNVACKSDTVEEVRATVETRINAYQELVAALREHIDATDHGSVSNLRNSTNNMRALLARLGEGG